MRNLRAVALCLGLIAAVAYAASPTITIATTDGAQGGSGSVCTAAGALGNIKTWNLQCAQGVLPGFKVYGRRACATSSAACILDAGYGDPVYDFTTITNDHLPQPARILLRTSESRFCVRNVAQPADAATADAGDAFKCFLNEDNPF